MKREAIERRKGNLPWLVSYIVGQVAVIVSCLWESGALAWFTGNSEALRPPDVLLADPGTLIGTLIVDVGGPWPRYAATLQHGITACLMAVSLYVLMSFGIGLVEARKKAHEHTSRHV